MISGKMMRLSWLCRRYTGAFFLLPLRNRRLWWEATCWQYMRCVNACAVVTSTKKSNFNNLKNTIHTFVRILKYHIISKIKFAVMSCNIKLQNFLDLQTYKQN